ncbi:GGDEF domain-containing protein [Marinobacter sp. R17]|uniref:sensor domain-containing diguanylate cyclase n=1 Tax=Marinobacter sp. R17 TaxID=2484250 RepID=UPI00168057A5|nr:GGDEF domain-containing protein [Marinobacter sp. R17]
MSIKEAGQKDWQEERYTLQRLLVRTSLFASGQDAAIDKLLGELRDVLRRETCDLGILRQVQTRLDQALERLDEKRSRSERDLHQALERILDQVEQTESAVRKQFRSLEKRIADLGPDSESMASWLTELATLLESHRETLDQPEDRGWRRFFSRQRHDAMPGPAGRPIENALVSLSEDPADDPRVNIARRVGELLEHVLRQVALEPSAHARAQHLKQLLDQSMEWPELRDALNEIVDLVIAAVSRSRNEFEAFLRRLDDRLAALKANCQAQAEARQDQRDASDRLNQAVSSRLEDMGQAVETSTSLDDLKASVSRNIQSLSSSFQAYREDECRREKALENELAAMQEKLAGMEAYSEQVQEQLRAERSRALTDMLTQLPNREAWQQRLQFEFERWQRYRHPASLAILDIDHFKTVNDSFGHKAGDRVIQLVAKVLCDRVRTTDFVARYGGEEFVLLLPETPVDKAYTVIDDLREHIADLPFHFQDEPVGITISAGLVAFEQAETPEELFDMADKALYRAKDAGRNQVTRA